MCDVCNGQFRFVHPSIQLVNVHTVPLVKYYMNVEALVRTQAAFWSLTTISAGGNFAEETLQKEFLPQIPELPDLRLHSPFGLSTPRLYRDWCVGGRRVILLLPSHQRSNYATSNVEKR